MPGNGAAPALGHCGGGDRRDFRGTLGERGLLEIWVGRAGGGRKTSQAWYQFSRMTTQVFHMYLTSTIQHNIQDLTSKDICQHNNHMARRWATSRSDPRCGGGADGRSGAGTSWDSRWSAAGPRWETRYRRQPSSSPACARRSAGRSGAGRSAARRSAARRRSAAGMLTGVDQEVLSSMAAALELTGVCSSGGGGGIRGGRGGFLGEGGGGGQLRGGGGGG